ncbi:MAG: glutaredoxin domain-containing protein [Gammaproteobacteria bacterium]|nr:glutaredoxin domain-containing protein [Gammaproteobacteria bacterium]
MKRKQLEAFIRKHGLTVILVSFVIWLWTMGPGFDNVRGELAPDNRVVVYTQTTCPPCWRLKLRLAAAGVPYREAVLDKSDAAMREFEDLIRVAKVQGGVGTPTVLVNNTLLLNNPDFADILDQLDYRD